MAFDGLDTFSTVSLNGKEMLRTDNMFTSYRVDITDSVHKENTLSIVFESALRRGKEIEEKEGVFTSIMGDTSRRYVHKAQYHYGIPTHKLKGGIVFWDVDIRMGLGPYFDDWWTLERGQIGNLCI